MESRLLSDSSYSSIFTDWSEEVNKVEMSEEEKDYLKSLKAQNIEYAKVETNLEDKITNTKSVFHSLSVAKKLSPKKEEINQLKKELIKSNLMKILSENQYKFTPERLIDIKKMVRGIDEWFKNLCCNHKGCKNQAINVL